MAKGDPKKPKGKMSAYAFFVQTCREEHKKKNPEVPVNFAEFSKKCSERWKVLFFCVLQGSLSWIPWAGSHSPSEPPQGAVFVPLGSSCLSLELCVCFCFLKLGKSLRPAHCPEEFNRSCSLQAMSGKEKSKFDEMAKADKVRYDREMKDYGPAKGGKKKKDPNAPKRPPSGFFLFCSEFRPKIKSTNPGISIGDVAKKLGEMWNNLSDSEKQPYNNKAAKLKEKYEKVRHTRVSLGHRAGRVGSQPPWVWVGGGCEAALVG
uniref:HMG box domain-containing protein n=1 Tax=Suricata suricatta TaxID=37032 RepID=A0A673VG25_SURSU